MGKGHARPLHLRTGLQASPLQAATSCHAPVQANGTATEQAQDVVAGASRSLSSYLTLLPVRPCCKVAMLTKELLEEILFGYGQKVPVQLISQWLKDQHDIQISPSTLSRHLRFHVT
jgi:hypothetical protein